MAQYKATFRMQGIYGEKASESYFTEQADMASAVTRAKALGNLRLALTGNGVYMSSISVVDYTTFFSGNPQRPFASQTISPGTSPVAGLPMPALSTDNPLRGASPVDVGLNDFVDEAATGRHATFVGVDSHRREVSLGLLPDSITTRSLSPATLANPSYSAVWALWYPRWQAFATEIQTAWKIMHYVRPSLVNTYTVLDNSTNVDTNDIQLIIKNTGAAIFKVGDTIKVRGIAIRSKYGRRVNVYKIGQVDALNDSTPTKIGDVYSLACSSTYTPEFCKPGTIEPVSYTLETIQRVDLKLQNHRRGSK